MLRNRRWTPLKVVASPNLKSYSFSACSTSRTDDLGEFHYSENRKRFGALDDYPSCACRQAEGKKALEHFSAAQTPLVAIGVSTAGPQSSALGNKAHELSVPNGRRADSTVVHATHSDRRTMKPVFKYTQHVTSIDGTPEI